MAVPTQVSNERTKLLANTLDRAGTSVVTVGCVTPIVSWILNIQGVRDALGPLGLGAFVAVACLAAAALHMGGRWVLRFLR